MSIPVRPRRRRGPAVRSVEVGTGPPGRPWHRRAADRARLELARHRRLRWLLVAALALASAAAVQRRADALDEARRGWATTATVLVAARDLRPGDELAIDALELPVVAVPPGALHADDRPDATPVAGDGGGGGPVERRAARVRRAVGAGEIVTHADLRVGVGPAAGAPDGTVVVAVRDPLVPVAEAGAAVAVHADGLELASGAVVVSAADGITSVAVDPADASIVAAAARDGTASLVFPT